MKYQSTVEAVYDVFGLPAWLAHGIETIPSNAVPGTDGDYIRVSIIASGRGVNHLSSSGQIIVDIFTKVGLGSLPAAVIADKLDAFLCGKVFPAQNGTVQTLGSSFAEQGVDPSNRGLFRCVYSVDFTFNGVF